MLETIRTALRVNLLEPIPPGPSFLLKFPRFSAFDQSPNRPNHLPWNYHNCVNGCFNISSSYYYHFWSSMRFIRPWRVGVTVGIGLATRFHWRWLLFYFDEFLAWLSRLITSTANKHALNVYISNLNVIGQIQSIRTVWPLSIADVWISIHSRTKFNRIGLDRICPLQITAILCNKDGLINFE